MKSLIYKAAAHEKVLSRARVTALGGVTVLMYHEIGPDHDDRDAWQVVRQSDFRAHVSYLRKHYEIVSLDTAVELIGVGANLSRPTVVITFDDGLRGNHQHLFPLVKELSIPVTIYIATKQVENQQTYWFDRIVNALDVPCEVQIDLSRWELGAFSVRRRRGHKRWSDIQRVLMALKTRPESAASDAAEYIESELAHLTHSPASGSSLVPMSVPMVQELAAHPLVTIGSHTHGHELLPYIPREEALATIDEASSRLRAWTGQVPRHFAYPSGYNDEATRDLVESRGFVTGVGTQAGLWTPQDDLMAIPRISVGRYDSIDKFKVNTLSGLGDVFRSTIF